MDFLVMCEDEKTPYMADEFEPHDFGVETIGKFELDGSPAGFVLLTGYMSEKLPRFLAKEPVMFLSDNVDCSVYLRGLYSESLSRARRRAMRGQSDT